MTTQPTAVAPPTRIRELFSGIAPRYDLLNTVLSLGIDRSWRRTAVSTLAGRDTRQVLDLCAGTLALTKELLRANPEASVTAIDFSRPMLDEGLTRLPPAMQSRVKAVEADFFAWEPTGRDVGAAAPRFYDAVMCAYGMRNLVDNRAALAKIHRLLRPRGRLVVLEFFRPDRWTSRLFHRTYAEFMIPTIGRFISRHRQAYRHLRDSVRGFFTLDEYAALLRETGFAIDQARRLTGGISGLIVADKL